MKTIPTTLEVLQGTQIQRAGQYLLIKSLGGLKNLVALGTPRLIKFYIMHPADGYNDECKLKKVYEAKRSTFCGRHIEFAIEYAEGSKTKKPTADKPEKIDHYKGRTIYRFCGYSIHVTRKTISTRRGCGLRNTTSVCDWHATNLSDPTGKPSFSGYGGIKDAVAKLNKIAIA